MKKQCEHKWEKYQSGGSDYNPFISCSKCGVILINPEEYFYKKGYETAIKHFKSLPCHVRLFKNFK